IHLPQRSVGESLYFVILLQRREGTVLRSGYVTHAGVVAHWGDVLGWRLRAGRQDVARAQLLAYRGAASVAHEATEMRDSGGGARGRDPVAREQLEQAPDVEEVRLVVLGFRGAAVDDEYVDTARRRRQLAGDRGDTARGDEQRGGEGGREAEDHHPPKVMSE